MIESNGTSLITAVEHRNHKKLAVAKTVAAASMFVSGVLALSKLILGGLARLQREPMPVQARRIIPSF
jgi:hypothetical protein